MLNKIFLKLKCFFSIPLNPIERDAALFCELARKTKKSDDEIRSMKMDENLIISEVEMSSDLDLLEVETWEDLLKKLQTMTPEQLKKPIQCLKTSPNLDEVQACFPGIAFATIDQLEYEYCRSSYDNKFHGEDFVILLDYNPFGKDGAIAYELKPGDKTLGKDHPIYGKNGKITREDQTSPKLKDRDKDSLGINNMLTLSHRMKSHESNQSD